MSDPITPVDPTVVAIIFVNLAESIGGQSFRRLDLQLESAEKARAIFDAVLTYPAEGRNLAERLDELANVQFAMGYFAEEDFGMIRSRKPLEYLEGVIRDKSFPQDEEMYRFF